MLEEYANLTIDRHDKSIYKTIMKNSSKIDYAYEYVRQLFPPRAASLADFGIIDCIPVTESDETFHEQIEKWLGQKSYQKNNVV